MTLRFLYSILFACLLIGLPVVSGTVYSQQNAISESDVLGVVNSVDTASRKGNVAGIVAPLAKDVKIKMTISSAKSPREAVLNLSKEQYASNVRQTFRRRLAYQLERKNTRVKIYDEKTAMVTSDIYETLTIRQGTLRAVSSEVAILSLRNGRIVFTSVEARIRLY